MKDNEILCKVYFPTKPFKQAAFCQLWTHLADLFQPNVFGVTEPFRQTYHADDCKEGWKIFKKEQELNFQGADHFFGSIYNFPYGITQLHLSSSFSWKEADIKKATQWFSQLYNDIVPFDFGFMTSQAEYDKKHNDSRALPSGGTVYGFVGDSMWDFLDYLPGLYWATLFGKRLVKAMPVDPTEIQDLNIRSLSTDKGSYGYCLNKKPIADELADCLEIEKSVSKLFGETYFFDRNAQQNAEHAPAFKRYLESLDR